MRPPCAEPVPADGGGRDDRPERGPVNAVRRRQLAREHAILNVLRAGMIDGKSYATSTTVIAYRLNPPRTNESVLRDLHRLHAAGLVETDGNRSTRWWWLA